MYRLIQSFLIICATLAAQHASANPTVAFLIGEQEYDTKYTLPAFAESELRPAGINTVFIHVSESDPNDFPDMQQLKSADLLVVSVRRRTPLKNQLDVVREHIDAGKPVIGIRTASHAFDRDPPSAKHDRWALFDREILGGHYQNHYGNKPPNDPPTLVSKSASAADHPILKHWPEQPSIPFLSHLYKNRDLLPSTTTLLNGVIRNSEGNAISEVEPVAWTRSGPKPSQRIFYTSLGSPEDFRSGAFRTLFRNAIYWTLDEEIPDAALPDIEPGKTMTGGWTPERSQAAVSTFPDLEIDLVLSEPIVQQPVFMNFDARGRLWIAQYLQYPEPAGLKMVSRDQYWRAVYDKVPPPPPHHFPGKDKITIHEDTNGDGKFDTQKIFVDGLNIVTSFAHGRGGVWVLNPPYLLFYPDLNQDDIPDADPEVHLQGFGLEDTHSVVNSLRWGPDGWLYAAQGSTVSAQVTRPGREDDPVRSMGQLIWRYHPETRKYEVFAEGGGNAFGVEIDAGGRVFSGHNGGNTRGFYYPQGGYLQKGFSKHGPLSNPFAYGYFPALRHPNVERFTHNFLIYDGGALPDFYNGKLFGVEPLQGRVVMSEISPLGATFETRDLGYAMKTEDPFFRPVDIKEGPDGAIYVADWYDANVNHYRNHEGSIRPADGRIYRIRAKGATQHRTPDLRQYSTQELVNGLNHPNIWVRQTIQRLLADRKDRSVAGILKQMLERSQNQTALEALWALHVIGVWDESIAAQGLKHPNPDVRRWAVRLTGEVGTASDDLLNDLIQIAENEANPEVAAQIASTARRLPMEQSMPLIRGLLSFDLKAETEEGGWQKDPYIPLLVWWTVETWVSKNSDALIEWMKGPELWNSEMGQNTLLERIMRRFADTDRRSGLEFCAKILSMAPNDTSREALMKGFAQASKGRALSDLPVSLAEALANYRGSGAMILQARQGSETALQKALDWLSDNNISAEEKLEAIRLFGEIQDSRSVKPLLEIATASTDPQLSRNALSALTNYNDPAIGHSVLTAYSNWPVEIKSTALSLLTSRSAWAVQLLEAIENKKLSRSDLTQDLVWKLRALNSEETTELLDQIFPSNNESDTAEQESRIQELAALLNAQPGDPYPGKELFHAKCSACHYLFDEGGKIGPDLTPYDRDNLPNLLLSIVMPNAEIREGFENFVIETENGRVLSGFLADQDLSTVTIRSFDGQNSTLRKEDIQSMESAGVSLMPQGLLEGLSDKEIRDLFAYLRSAQPLNN